MNWTQAIVHAWDWAARAQLQTQWSWDTADWAGSSNHYIFWLVWATKLKSVFCAARPRIWLLFSLCSLRSHANEQQRFPTSTDHISWTQHSLINANCPETLLSDYGSQAWEGPLIPLMSHKRQRIIHSNSLDIGWYFNWSLTLGVYLPTELAHAQIPQDRHLHK